MKTSKFTDEQVAMGVAPSGARYAGREICRKLGVSEQNLLPLEEAVRSLLRRRRRVPQREALCGT